MSRVSFVTLIFAIIFNPVQSYGNNHKKLLIAMSEPSASKPVEEVQDGSTDRPSKSFLNTIVTETPLGQFPGLILLAGIVGIGATAVLVSYAPKEGLAAILHHSEKTELKHWLELGINSTALGNAALGYSRIGLLNGVGITSGVYKESSKLNWAFASEFGRSDIRLSTTTSDPSTQNVAFYILVGPKINFMTVSNSNFQDAQYISLRAVLGGAINPYSGFIGITDVSYSVGLGSGFRMSLGVGGSYLGMTMSDTATAALGRFAYLGLLTISNQFIFNL